MWQSVIHESSPGDVLAVGGFGTFGLGDFLTIGHFEAHPVLVVMGGSFEDGAEASARFRGVVLLSNGLANAPRSTLYIPCTWYNL